MASPILSPSLMDVDFDTPHQREITMASPILSPSLMDVDFDIEFDPEFDPSDLFLSSVRSEVDDLTNDDSLPPPPPLQQGLSKSTTLKRPIPVHAEQPEPKRVRTSSPDVDDAKKPEPEESKSEESKSEESKSEESESEESESEESESEESESEESESEESESEESEKSEESKTCAEPAKSLSPTNQSTGTISDSESQVSESGSESSSDSDSESTCSDSSSSSSSDSSNSTGSCDADCWCKNKAGSICAPVADLTNDDDSVASSEPGRSDSEAGPPSEDSEGENSIVGTFNVPDDHSSITASDYEDSLWAPSDSASTVSDTDIPTAKPTCFKGRLRRLLFGPRSEKYRCGNNMFYTDATWHWAEACEGRFCDECGDEDC